MARFKRGQPMLARFQNDVVEPATIKVLQFLPKGKNMFLPLFVNFDPLRCSAINFLNFLPKSIFSQKKNRKNECTDIVRRKKQVVPLYQCDQMARLFVHYLAIYRNENLPKSPNLVTL